MKPTNLLKNLDPLWLVLLGAAFFLPYLGSVHLFDWDEINFAESAREMILTGNYAQVQIDFQPFWEKPPLFFWLQVLAMKAFGINEFAARLPNAIAGIVTLLTLFFVGKRLYDKQFGFLWALAYLGSVTPHLYFKSGIIDPIFNYFMFLSIVFLTRKQFLLAGLLAGLAIWTKGPVGAGIPLLTLGAVWAINRFKPVLRLKDLFLFGLTAATLGAGWVGFVAYTSGFGVVQDFFAYLLRLLATSEAGHGQPFYYHFVVVLIGAFPISIIAIRFLKIPAATASQPDFKAWMVALFWVVMVVFSVVKTKIVHYSSMTYFPLSFLAAYHLYLWQKGEIVWKKSFTVLLISIGFILSFLLAAVPLVGMYARRLAPYINDKFMVANLKAPVPWSGYEWLFGVVYFGAICLVIFLLNRRKALAIRVLFFATAALMFGYSAVVVPKIEGYSQRTAIDFYESKAYQDVYVQPLGFKSYAHLYYGRKQPPTNPKSYDENWLLNGEVDKPVFFVARIDRYQQYKSNPNLEFIKEENGFVFLRRKPDYKRINESLSR